MQVPAVLALTLLVLVPARAQDEIACPSDDAVLCTMCLNCSDNNEFTVQGITMRFKFGHSSFLEPSLSIICEATSAATRPLEERHVPVFGAGLLAQRLTVDGCPVPAGSYGALFTALNVSFPSDGLRLSVTQLAGGETLARGHFAGLSTLSHLNLQAVGPLSLAVLEDLPLKNLYVEDSPILTGFISLENSTLESISLTNTAVSCVPALPKLRWLTVVENATVVLEPGSPLHDLHLDRADEEVMSKWAPLTAQDVTLVQWVARRPSPIPTCKRLWYLRVVSPLASSLPAGWVAACPLLMKLKVQLARGVAELPATLLANATSLYTFNFTHGALASLPAGLFDESPRLANIDLTGNRLHVLPSGLFHGPRAALRVLRLGSNRLTRAVLDAGLGPLPALITLVLADNTDLADSCRRRQPIRDGGIYLENKDVSGLNNLRNLKKLDLKNTSVRAICRDWRLQLTRLKVLDLSYTKIDRLTSEDLQFAWKYVDEESEVRLEHTPLVEIAYGSADYWADAKLRDARRVRVTVGGREARLPCDCGVYWPTAALLDGVGPLRLASNSSLWCHAPALHELRRPYIDSLLCERRELCAGVPAACRCGARALLGDRKLLRVECAAAGLAAVPRLPSLPTDVTVEMLLADNDITVLHLDDLPSNITTIDLRNNTLERVEEQAALSLVIAAAHGARVLLAGTRLTCSCGTAGALRTLLRLEPRPELTCATGRPVDTALAALHCEETSAAPLPALIPTASLPPVFAPAPTPTPRAVLGPTLGVLLILAVLVGMVFALPCTRRRFKSLLTSLRGEESPQFDLFVAFGAGCERQALEVCARLEPRYAVCLQERDWVPPARVATCLQQSVAASRRTLALATAQWAAALDAPTAEGAALAAALRSRRLLAVLLEPAPPGALRRYLARHPRAELRYSDPDFWQQLSAALPPPSHRADVVSNA